MESGLSLAQSKKRSCDDTSHDRFERIEKITKEDVVAWANKYLPENGYAIVYKREGVDKSQQKIAAPKITPIVTNRDKQSAFIAEIQKSVVKPIDPVFVDYKKDMDIFKSQGMEVLYKEKKINDIAEKCLMCDKCHALCPVGVDAPSLRRAQRATVNNSLVYDYSYLKSCQSAAAISGSFNAGVSETMVTSAPEVMYFAGCMTHLTPRIIKSVEKVFKAASVNYVFADRDGGICCGRPLMLAGKTSAAQETIAANKKMILESGCRTLVLSCPICYKIFKEEYGLKDIEVLHYTQYIKRLVDDGRLKLNAGGESIVYHDPCELGRGCGVYAEPRNVLSQVGTLVKAGKEGDESVCCGGSLGSLTLDARDRAKITESSLANLVVNKPQTIVTACPLCLMTFSGPALDAVNAEGNPVKVNDFAEVVSRSISI